MRKITKIKFYSLVIITVILNVGCDKTDTVPNNESPKNGLFTEITIDNHTKGVGSIVLEDVNGDNNLDLLVAGLEDSQIVLWKNNGHTPDNWSKTIIAFGVNQSHTAINIDLDNDGDLDIVGAAYNGQSGVSWWRNDGSNPTIWIKLIVDSHFINTHQLKSVDLDDDGDYDIIAISSSLNQISWWKNNGGYPIVWEKQIINSNSLLAKSIAIADLDNDGDLDLTCASLQDNKINWWRNDGGNPILWKEITIDASFIGAHYVQCIDIDNDGYVDILGAAYLGHEVAWWKNNGGDFDSWTKQSLSSNVTNACVAKAADMDNDGDLDIVGTAQGANKIFLWTNNGGNPINWTQSIMTNNLIRPWPLDIADIDNDGDNDIVSGSSHNGSNKIKAWINNHQP